VKKLQEAVTRLHSVRQDEREMDRIFSETLQLQSPEPQLQWRHRQSLSIAEPSVETLRKAKAGSWTSGTKSRAPAQSEVLQLCLRRCWMCFQVKHLD